MKKILNIFRLTNEEWWPAVVAIVYVAALQFLGVRYGFMRFGGVTDDIHQQLIAHFQVSGFDAWSYEILTRWFPAYDIYRHPLIRSEEHTSELQSPPISRMPSSA